MQRDDDKQQLEDCAVPWPVTLAFIARPTLRSVWANAAALWVSVIESAYKRGGWSDTG